MVQPITPKELIETFNEIPAVESRTALDAQYNQKDSAITVLYKSSQKPEIDSVLEKYDARIVKGPNKSMRNEYDYRVEIYIG